MLEVRCSSAERLSGDLRALARSPLGGGEDGVDDVIAVATGGAADLTGDDVTNANTGESTSTAMDIDVESILSRARENVIHSRRLRMQAPDFVKRLPAFSEGKVGDKIQFQCRCTSFPLAKVTWYHDSDPIDLDDPRFRIQPPDDGVHILILLSAKKSDEGAFKCKATNEDGSASTIGYLSVTGERRRSRGKVQNNSPKHAKKRSVSLSPDLRTITEQRAKEEEETEKEETRNAHKSGLPTGNSKSSSTSTKSTCGTNNLGSSPPMASPDMRMTTSMIVQSFSSSLNDYDDINNGPRDINHAPFSSNHAPSSPDHAPSSSSARYPECTQQAPVSSKKAHDGHHVTRRQRERAPERHRNRVTSNKSPNSRENTRKSPKADDKFLKPLPDNCCCHSDTELVDENVRLSPIRKSASPETVAFANPPPLPLPLDGSDFDLRNVRMTLTPVKAHNVDLKLSHVSKRTEKLGDDEILGVKLRNVRKETAIAASKQPQIIRVEERPVNLQNENMPTRAYSLKTTEAPKSPSHNNLPTNRETTSEARQRIRASRDPSIIPLLRSMENVRLPQLTLEQQMQRRLPPVPYRRIRIPSEVNQEPVSSIIERQRARVNADQPNSGEPNQKQKHRANVPKVTPRTPRIPARQLDTHYHLLSRGDGKCMIAIDEVIRQYHSDSPPFGVLFDELLVLMMIVSLASFVALVSNTPAPIYFLAVGILAVVIFRSGFVRSRLLHGCMAVCSVCRGQPVVPLDNRPQESYTSRRIRHEIRLRRLLLFSDDE